MDDSDDLSAFLGALHDTSSAWTKKTFIAGTPVIMKMDTGADVTAISEEDFSSIRPKPQLDISRRVLRGQDGKPMHVLGAFNASILSIDSRLIDPQDTHGQQCNVTYRKPGQDLPGSNPVVSHFFT